MRTTHVFGLLALGLWVGSDLFCWSMPIAPPVGFLKTRAISSDVTVNPATSDVYLKIIDFLESDPLIKAYEPGVVRRAVSLAWRGEPGFKENVDGMTIKKGTLMFDLIREDAARRGVA